MGPRLVSRGKQAIKFGFSVKLLLQWGRDLLVAESPSQDRPPLPKNRLQWGRDLLVAESVERSTEKMDQHKLQWGRDLLVAESRQRTRSH